MLSRPFLLPGTALAFSVLVAFLGPQYSHWFGESIPAFTRGFFSAYPLWIIVSTAAVAMVAFGEQFPAFALWRLLWSGLDIALAFVSALIVAIGLVAMFLPLLLPPIPGG